MRVVTALATTTVVVGAFALAATPAHADLVTHCVGDGGAVTVPGDLVVPAGKSCQLDGTTVKGKVRVQPGANLIVTDGDFRGKVTIASDGFLSATDSVIAGKVTSKDGFGTELFNTDVGSGYTAAGNVMRPFLVTQNASIDGSVDVNKGLVDLVGTSVNGALKSVGSDYTDAYDSTVASTVRVEGNEFGSVFCASEVHGNASFLANTSGVQLGRSGTVADCEGGSMYWGRNLTVSDNTGGVEVSDNIVVGNLSGTGNTPAPTGADNRVRGTASGQFADLQPPAAARTTATPAHRDAAISAAAQKRHTEAATTAGRAGKAF